ncbi:30S ribosomal protein S3 [Caulobacter segnis]
MIIERPHKKCRITIYAARPGVIIGKKGADIDKLRKDLSVQTEGEVHLNIVEIRKPETDAQLVAESIASTTRASYRLPSRHEAFDPVGRASRLQRGIRINVSGRLGGAEIARMEWYREGRAPLHTLRADIDFGFAEAKTTYGIIGVKTWIFKGEVLSMIRWRSTSAWPPNPARPAKVAAVSAAIVPTGATVVTVAIALKD